jgi:hypothetical protein
MDWGSVADWVSGVATAAAVIVALSGYGFLEWQRARDRRDAQRTAGRQIGIKLARVLNGTHDIYRHLWALYEGPPLGGEGASELWRTIHPLIGLEHEPGLILNAAETDLLLNLDATDFMMELMLATGRYQSIVSSMKDYAVRYEAMYQMMPPPVAMNGVIGQHHLSQQDYLRLRPYSLQLETIIQALRAMTAENVEICKKLAEQYHPLMKGYFQERFMSLSPIEIEEPEACPTS